LTEYYTPKQVAYFLYKEKYDLISIEEIVTEIYKKEYSFINKKYQDNNNLFLEKTIEYYSYFALEPLYEKQLENGIDFDNHLKKYEEFIDNFSPNFFLNTRLMLLSSKHNYKIIKLRTLLKEYGYKSRVSHIILYFRDNILFYHLKTYRKGEEIDIFDFELDDRITFKLDNE